MRGAARRTSFARVLALAAAGLVAGCADYLNNYDTVTLAAGDTQKANMLMQTARPFNPASQNNAIETNGVRAADAVKRYEDSQKAGEAEPQNVTVNVGSIGTK